MFRISSSRPIDMKPVSYVSKIKNLKGIPNKADNDEKIIEEIENSLKKDSNFPSNDDSNNNKNNKNDSNDDKNDKNNKNNSNSDKNNNDKSPKEDQSIAGKIAELNNKSEESIEKQVQTIVEKRLKQIIKKKDEKNEKLEKERDKVEEEYAKLCKLVENKLGKIDEIADYIKTNFIDSKIEEEKPKEEETKPELESKKEKAEPEKQEALLGQKRKRKVYTHITDEEWAKVKEQYDLKDEKKDCFYCEGGETYVEIKGRKKKVDNEIMKTFK